MKRLVLCFDGTWNAVATPDANTNVVRLANLVTTSDSKGVPQICYYNSGVGSGGPIDRFIGGAFGAGLKNNVKRGLAFLALNYDKGDEIYLFGFSRGGYTARALAGVLGTAGIPLDIAETERHWTLYQDVAKLRDKAGRYAKGSPRRLPYDAKIKAKKEELANATRFKGEEPGFLYSRFSNPIPCSPVIVPPTSMHARMMSSHRPTTRAYSGECSSKSKKGVGCMLPSPAWKKFATPIFHRRPAAITLRMTSGRCDRGAHTSSIIVRRPTRPMAP